MCAHHYTHTHKILNAKIEHVVLGHEGVVLRLVLKRSLSTLLLLVVLAVPSSVQGTLVVSQRESLDLATRPLVLADYLNQWSTPQSYEWDGWAFHECGISDTPGLTINGTWANLASVYTPLIGPYDASDEAVIEYHVRLAQASGIDAFVVDWDGLTAFNDFQRINTNFKEMLKVAEIRGFGVAIDYDAMRFYVGHTAMPGAALIPNS